MKTVKHMNIFGSILLGAFLIAAFPSCTKDSSSGVSLTGTVSLMVVNGTEGSAPQDFYSDDSKVNASAVAYSQNSSYITTNAGNHQGQFRTSGTTTVNASANMVFETGKFYTVYLAGDGSSSSAVTTNDDMTPPPSGQARVRFVHVSSAAAASIDLIATNGTKIVSGLAYKTASTYNNVDANSSFTLYAAGSVTALLTTPAFAQAGKIYTVYISGSTTATVSAHVIADN